MVPLNKLFDVTYGNKLDANKLEKAAGQSEGVNFVGRSSQNHGVSERVRRLPAIEPFEAGLITVALGGSKLLSAFVQEAPFYTAQNVAVLKPLEPMTFQQKLYACLAIRHNRFRYSAFGREANRTIKSMLIPSLDDLPAWTLDFQKTSVDELDRPAFPEGSAALDTSTWQSFRYDAIFHIKKGYYNKKPPVSLETCGVPFIGATDKRNGITAFVSRDDLVRFSRDGSIRLDEPTNRKLFPAPCITVSNNGSVGEVFFQKTEFTCSHDVNPIYLKDKSVALSEPLALFLCTVIRAEKYRWGYGRKWRPIRMPSSTIRLPVLSNGVPDWRFMENYVLSLPYSSQLPDVLADG